MGIAFVFFLELETILFPLYTGPIPFDICLGDWWKRSVWYTTAISAEPCSNKSKKNTII